VVTVRDFKVDHSSQHRPQASVVGGGERGPKKCVELAEHPLDDGLEATRPRCQVNERRPSVRRVRRSPNEAVALEQADHRRHRLLAQPGAGGELAHPQAVLLEEGDEQRAVRRTDLREARVAEPLGQQLVPALRRLREQEAEVLPSRTLHD
jgi:hypothetical protein